MVAAQVQASALFVNLLFPRVTSEMLHLVPFVSCWAVPRTPPRVVFCPQNGWRDAGEKLDRRKTTFRPIPPQMLTQTTTWCCTGKKATSPWTRTTEYLCPSSSSRSFTPPLSWPSTAAQVRCSIKNGDFCFFSLCVQLMSMPVCSCWPVPPSRLVQSLVHPLHSAAPHLLLPAADLLPCHPHGHAVLGVLLDRPQGRPCQGALR